MRMQATNIPVTLDAMLPENSEQLKKEISKACGTSAQSISDVRITRKSIDARKKQNVHFVLTCEFDVDSKVKLRPIKGVQLSAVSSVMNIKSMPDFWYEPQPGAPHKLHAPQPSLAPQQSTSSTPKPTSNARYIIVGAGPAGLFCALYLARAGLKPLLIERGQPVEARQQTIENFNNGADLNPNSNIQFGEGGAGTFSDGKLTTGKKDLRIPAVLQTFVECGAPPDILVDAKPHIGTDYLPTVVSNLRQKIIAAGGEVLFNTQLVDIEFDTRIQAATLQNVQTEATYKVPAKAIVLATGHSARDTFELLNTRGIKMERKPFAVGVRMEHSQDVINRAQYGPASTHPALPPADYKLNVRTRAGRGVYTFCMCPGGTVVAAASESQGVCVNGMSNFARNGQNANSALLVEVLPEDFPGTDVLAGMYFQRELEHAAYNAGIKASQGAAFTAPMQSVGDFLETTNLASINNSAASLNYGEGSASYNSKESLPFHAITPTYPRGTAHVDLHDCLPPLITDALTEALPLLDKKLHGFADPAAVMTAVEARSSSPVRVVRNAETLQSVTVSGLYPAGEGAGYAGGIMSAAVDGLRVAEAIVQNAYVEISVQAAYVYAGEDTSAQTTIMEAAQALRAGKPVIFPTDTVMGIGVSVEAAKSPSVLAKIKGRHQDKPIAWLVADVYALDIYGQDVPQYAKDLAAKHWPGALTLIVKASANVPSEFISPQGTIGLRMPDSVIALQLIKEAGSPLAVTSANLAGDLAPATAQDLGEEFFARATAHGAFLVDAQQQSPSATPSAVIDCTHPTTPHTLR